MKHKNALRMPFQYFTYMAIVLTMTEIITASPFPILTGRQTVNCSQTDDSYISFHPECWNILGVADYLGNPSTGWIRKTPLCDQITGRAADGSGCCLRSEPWSSCFLRLGQGVPGADCSHISSQSCIEDRNSRPAQSSALLHVILDDC